MEKIYFSFSLNKIPIPSRTLYKLQLIDNIESVIKRMRWKAHFFLNNNEKKKTIKKRNSKLLDSNGNIIQATERIR